MVTKVNETVSDDVANVLNLLKIEPMEIGLDLTSVLEGGIIYEKGVLDIDVNDYINNIGLAINQMINLSIHTGYLVPLTAEISIQKAFIEAKSLALEAGVIDKSIIGELLLKAVREANELNSLVPEVKEESEKPAEDKKAEAGKEEKTEEKKD